LLGRIDHQVKIRGFRIELGEIISALRQHPAVQDALVIAREDEPGNKRLVGYIVPAAEREPAVVELRNFLKQLLPEYMVPAAFVMMSNLPLSPNGKLDRRSLPAPEATRPELAESLTAPRNAVEEVVAGIWAEVLNLQQVGVHDNFFELGGHSLLATKVNARLHETFLLDVPLRLFFEAPTVAELAASLVLISGAEGRDIEQIAQVFAGLDQLSDEEVKMMLAENGDGQDDSGEEQS
jgi:hypothetical protein